MVSSVLILTFLFISPLTEGYVFKSFTTPSSLRVVQRIQATTTSSLETINIPRKMKRILRGLNETTFESIYTEEFDAYLKTVASTGIYENLRKQLTKTARQLNIQLKPDFGVKAAVVLPSIIETATTGGFSTLVTAITAAGLVDTLSGPGPFTVFAPSNDAFAKLEAGKLEAILADVPGLQSILTYHVAPALYKSKKIAKQNGEKIATVNGKELAIKVAKTDVSVTIEGVKIVKSDLRCSNGIIHVIDTVLIPK